MPEVNEHELRAIDSELAELLAVEPSPEFAATVRMRIQQEPARIVTWRWWAVAAAGAAAIVAAFIFTGRSQPVPQSPAAMHADRVLPAPGVIPADTTAATPPVRRRQDHIAARTRPAEPEVLIDPALAAAVKRLATERPTLPVLPQEPSLDLVVVEPLKVPEISDAGTKQGDRQ